MADENKKNSSSTDVEDTAVDLSAFDTDADTTQPESQADDQLKKDLEKCQRDYLYLRADFDNYKRLAIKERSDLVKFGNERLLVEILNMVDTFDQALAMEITAENFVSFRDGMSLLRNEFQSMFGRLGVQKIESHGQPYDPNILEAIASEPTDLVPPGHVCRVFKPAYKLHDRVIRPGQVVVAREIKADG